MAQEKSRSAGESLIGRTLSESLMKAQAKISKYIEKKKQYSLKDIPPQNQPELERLKLEADKSTLTAFDALKNYARDEMGEVWMEKQVGTYNGEPVIFGSSTHEDAEDDKWYLDAFRSRTLEWEEEEHIRFKGDVLVQHSAPAIMDSIHGYSNTWELLMETMKRAEFAPKAPMPEYRAGDSEEEILTHDEADYE